MGCRHFLIIQKLLPILSKLATFLLSPTNFAVFLTIAAKGSYSLRLCCFMSLPIHSGVGVYRTSLTQMPRQLYGTPVSQMPGKHHFQYLKTSVPYHQPFVTPHQQTAMTMQHHMHIPHEQTLVS